MRRPTAAVQAGGPRSPRPRTGARAWASWLVCVLALAACGSTGEIAATGGSELGAASGEGSMVPSAPTPAADPAADETPRVLFVGDSLMFGAIDALDATFGSRGVETRYVGYAGTGLLSGQGWWNREISAQVEMWQPDVVVIEACCNYANGEHEYETPTGEVAAPDSEQMFAAWAEAATAAVSRARAGGAEVFWATTPCAAWPPDNLHRLRAQRFSAIVDAIEVEPIDWRGALCPGDVFASTLEVDGQEVELRRRDGLHLAAAGNLIVAETTWEAVAGAL